jgi:hypothetical protein
LLTQSEQRGRVLRMTDRDERRRLRARDSGNWTDPDPRPAFPVVRTSDGLLAPGRDPATRPELLDLAPQYTISVLSNHSGIDSVLPDLTDVPIGTVRLDGTDFDVRGGIELRQERAETLAASGLRAAATGIRVPAVPIAAFHVLLLSSLPTPESEEREYARLRVHYRDGTSALLPIRTQREVPGMTDRDRPTPVGWVRNKALVNIGLFRDLVFSSPRLPNPHPERLAASLDLETGSGWAEPVFLAVTAEPVPGS